MFGVPYEYDKAIIDLLDAATDLSVNFGCHEGECEFSERCPECNASKHACPLHTEAFRRRNDHLVRAIIHLEELRATRAEKAGFGA